VNELREETRCPHCQMYIVKFRSFLEGVEAERDGLARDYVFMRDAFNEAVANRLKVETERDDLSRQLTRTTEVLAATGQEAEREQRTATAALEVWKATIEKIDLKLEPLEYIVPDENYPVSYRIPAGCWHKLLAYARGVDAGKAHTYKLLRAFGEIENILGTADLSETVEMVRRLQDERDKAVVRAKYLEKADQRMIEAQKERDTVTAALAAAEADRNSLRTVISNECPIGALDIATSLRVELQHTQDALAATESHAARHHAELAGAEAVIGTLREELGEARKALAYIASRPEGQDEPGERNARRAAWRMAQRARVALGRSHKGWLPTVDDLAGSDPGFTGGLDSVEYVRRMRDEDEGATGGEAM
jgi:hypothetical protein